MPSFAATCTWVRPSAARRVVTLSQKTRWVVVLVAMKSLYSGRYRFQAAGAFAVAVLGMMRTRLVCLFRNRFINPRKTGTKSRQRLFTVSLPGFPVVHPSTFVEPCCRMRTERPRFANIAFGECQGCFRDGFGVGNFQRGLPRLAGGNLPCLSRKCFPEQVEGVGHTSRVSGGLMVCV